MNYGGMRMTTIFFALALVSARAADTLFTHPVYPPIVYEGDEYNFYKCTPKYVPENMLHCFKILGTTSGPVLDRFKNRSTEDVVERGLFEDAYRLRKEFCLEGYSGFVAFFHRRGIYSPWAMQTYILLSFHQYLRQEPIRWHHNKKLAIEDIRRDNKNWKSRARKINDPLKERSCPEPDPEDGISEEDAFFRY
jgi:hypothetical protein